MTSESGWTARAVCIGKGPIMFAEDPTDAKAICRRCPVKSQCLGFALNGDILDGVWGGLDGDERTRTCPICRRAKEPTALGCKGAHDLERLAQLIEMQMAGDESISVSIRSTPTAPTSPGCIQPRGRSHSSAKAYNQGCRCAAALTALRTQRAARPPAPPHELRTSEERFLELIEVSDDGHWWWTGSVNGSGYANFWDGGRVVRAHLFAYGLFVGPMPEGGRLKGLDQRGERPCVNPEHFELKQKGKVALVAQQ